MRVSPFSTTVVLLGLAFIGGICLTHIKGKAVAQLEKRIQTHHDQIKALLDAKPTPTLENLTIARETIKRLEERKQRLHQQIESASKPWQNVDLTPPQLLFNLKEFVDTFTNAARAREKPILIKEDASFGFGVYTLSGEPPASAYAHTIAQQYKITEDLLRKLYASEPHRILSVKREMIDPRFLKGRAILENNDFFTPPPHIYKDKQEQIRTLAFELTFTGYTQSLRHFLNQLANKKNFANAPILIRSVTVRPIQSPEGTPIDNPADQLDTLFASMQDRTDAIEPAEEPIITGTHSHFSVVVECIQSI